MAIRQFNLNGDVRSRGPFRSPHAARAVAAGLAPILLLYALYTLLRWTFIDRAAIVGDHNADRVLEFERNLNLDQELWLQHQVVEHSGVVWFLNHYYVFAFFPMLVGGAVLAAIRAPRAFRYWRTVFVVSLGLALVGFALFPLTPPRLLPDLGYVDTLMLRGPQYYGDEAGSSFFNAYGSIPSMVNEYAAMPSMHVGWSAIAGLLFVAAFPGRRWLVGLAVLHVILMQIAVVATGNHYLIDGIAGLLVVLVAALIAGRIPQLRNVWDQGPNRSRPGVPATGGD
jgi:membrane-associated phospholipid phosphatase